MFYKSPHSSSLFLLPLRNEEKADEENISHGNEIMEKEMSFGAACHQNPDPRLLDGICWFVRSSHGTGMRIGKISSK